jgi:hypothetical protein
VNSNVEFLRTFLADRDAPCPSCAYNLRGLAFDRCPECNRELVLRVGLLEPRLGLWLAAVIVQSLNVGFFGLLLGYFVFVMIFDRRGGPPNEFLFFVLIPFLVNAPVFVAMLVWARRIRRASTPARVSLLVLAVILTITGFLLFAMNVH